MTPLQQLLALTAVASSCLGQRNWKEVTISGSGAPCWFDMKPNNRDCAVCSEEGQQCGYPMHNRCRKYKNGNKDEGWKRGCKGISRKVKTLSQMGHPCPWDPADRSCPWCSADSVLCIESGRIRCFAPDHAKGSFGAKYHLKCKSQQCTEFPEACHPNASCKKFYYERKEDPSNKGTYIWDYTKPPIYRCVCNEGYIGNGVTCADAVTGLVFDNRVHGTMNVRLSMNLSRDALVDEGLWDEKPLGENTDQVYNNAENLPNSGKCNSTTAICAPVEQDRKLLFRRDEL